MQDIKTLLQDSEDTVSLTSLSEQFEKFEQHTDRIKHLKLFLKYQDQLLRTAAFAKMTKRPQLQTKL